MGVFIVDSRKIALETLVKARCRLDKKDMRSGSLLSEFHFAKFFGTVVWHFEIPFALDAQKLFSKLTRKWLSRLSP